MRIKKLYVLLSCLGLASCAIENDIPYPIVEAAITGMTVEGQRSNPDNNSTDATINTTARTVTLFVNDSVDITNLKITQLRVSNNAELLADSAACADYGHFPDAGFFSLDSIPVSSNTRMDFSKPVNFTLRTYQDYVWKVTVNQIIERNIEITGMIRSIVNVENRTVIVYVGADQDLSRIQITTLNLGGEYGRVRYGNSEDIAGTYDFSTSSQKFLAARANEDTWEEWTVFVYHSEDGSGTSGDIFAMASRAVLNGSVQSGKTPVIEYRESGSSNWEEVPSTDVTVSGTSYTAVLKGLTPNTPYQYRVSVDGIAGNENTFTTVQAIALENGSLENWREDQTSTDRNYYVPNAEGVDFWGTGNLGAAPFIGNLTTPEENESVSGWAARLESKDAIIKIGAGNLFTGDFQMDPDTHIDGLLHFGRPFSSFPTGLKLWYKYTPAEMTRKSTTQLPANLESLVGEMDSCHIYIALSDKSEPYEIRTNVNNRQLFDKNDANIIAYGEYISGKSISDYQQIKIPLTYRAYRVPKYIIIVCAASKYGDYYLGGIGSTLWIDEMELVYE